MRKEFSIVLGLAAIAAAPAAAKDRMGLQAIASGDFGAAERTLVAERRIFPGRPELMLNLAAVYRQTGRVAAARDLYTEAASAPDVMLALPNGGTASSRDLASAALARLAGTETASR